MSVTTRTGRYVRPAAVLVAVTLAVYGLFGVGDARDAAALPVSLSLNYSCNFPAIGVKTIKVDMQSDVPKKLPLGVNMPRIVVNTTTTIDADTNNGLQAVGAYLMEGSARAFSGLVVPEYPDGLAVQVGVNLGKTLIPPAGPFSVKAPGSILGPQFSKAGEGKIIIKDLELRPVLTKEDGSLTQIGKPTLKCAQLPGQNAVLATFEIVDTLDTEAPSKPGDVEAIRAWTPKADSSSVDLVWKPSEDNVEVAAYDVLNGDTVVGGSAFSTPKATVTGLTPNTSYELRVRARDLTGNMSEPSDPVTVRTPAFTPDTQAPTTPGKPVVADNSLTNAVKLAWAESKDDRGVAGYEVYSGGQVVAESVGPEVWVRPTTASTAYSFTVVAKDEAGNRSRPSEAVAVTTPAGPPAECGKDEVDDYPERGCVYMAGYANVEKMDAAALLNDPEKEPTLANIAYRIVRDEAKQFTTTEVKFKLNGPLRTRSTFLTFGFMPTSATMELTQSEAGTLTASGPDGGDLTIKGLAEMSVRIYDVTVNGTPLDVGDKCTTVKPIALELAGGSPEITDPLMGGPLRGMTPIPAFTGCGVKEDLDRVFTASISNIPNFIKITQGKVCRTNTGKCDPVVPLR